ncbi:MAG: acyl--CoA ligase [Sphingomonadales bacterium]|nr:acyl--CoA ligase [Sphingomonadales bacterium]
MAQDAAYWPARCEVPLREDTLGDALRASAVRFPARAALAWAEGDGLARLNYAEMLGEAERIARWLLARARPGDRIAPWGRNSVEWALLEFGCALAGMVVAAWNPGWSDFECAHALALTEPALVLAGHDTRGEPLLDRAVALAGVDRVVALDGLRAVDAPRVALPAVRPADLFLIQFTSGTTGRAKGAMLSHRAVVNAAWLRVQASGADESDVFLNPSPLSHMGGSVTMLPGAILAGACYVVMNRFDAGEYLRLMRLAGVTRIGGVPTVLASVLDHADWVPGSARLRAVGAGGAQVPQPLIERLMREFDAPVLVSYAQSECPIVTSSTPGDAPRLLAETVGRPAPHVELKIADPASGAVVSRDAIGEVCVRAPVRMLGYWRAEAETAATIDADGWLHTGDLGTLDDDGFLRICGRSRDVVIRGGENVYPAEVEDALLAHPGVAQVAVVGVPDDRWGQQVGAAVLCRAGCAPTPAELEAHAATRLAHFKVPRVWQFVSAFPLTPNGKIAKVGVEKLFIETAAGKGEA